MYQVFLWQEVFIKMKVDVTVLDGKLTGCDRHVTEWMGSSLKVHLYLDGQSTIS